MAAVWAPLCGRVALQCIEWVWESQWRFGGGSGVGFECWAGDNRSPFLAYYLMHHHHSKNNYFLSLPLRIIITTIQHGTFS